MGILARSRWVVIASLSAPTARTAEVIEDEAVYDLVFIAIVAQINADSS